MPEKIAVALGNVQKTLLLPLWGRAFETQKEKPLLVDRTALAVVEKLDYDFAPLAQNLSPLTQIAWIMRSQCVDEVINNFLQHSPQATIVNIGCGLDTTFERVDNGQLTWYDLDLPDVIHLRQQFIPETERRHYLATSFLEEGWLKTIDASRGLLLIAAGVFYYFEESQIKQLLLRLADTFPRCELFFDASSPYGVRVANKKVITSSGLDEKSFLKWGLEDPQSLAAWDQRIRVLKCYYYFGQRARRLPLRLRLIGLLSDRLKVQYMLHLAITNP